MEPIYCALRYVHLREYEDDLITDRSEGFISVDSTKAHMTFNHNELNHVVSLHDGRGEELVIKTHRNQSTGKN